MPTVKPYPLAKWFKSWSRLFGPFVGANIRISKQSPDFREMETRMKLRWFNQNWVGTHFGGSLFSMTDGFYAFMLMNILGREYTVWDKSACIMFKRPGSTEMIANFHIPEERVQEIIEKTKTGEPYLAEFQVDVMDTNNKVVASVEKKIYVRKKQ